jgi:SH3 domain protein
MKKIVLGLTLLLCHLPMFAQDTAVTDKDRQYVTDQLRLSLYEGANSQSKVLKLLVSGDVLDVDEIRGAYALVTTGDGSKGWVKRGFLVSQPTAVFQLREEQRKTAELQEEIDRLANSKVVIEAYEKDMDTMSEKLREKEYQQEQSVETIAALEAQVASTQQQLDRKLENNEPAHEVLWRTSQTYWKILVPSLLFLLLLCFLLSKVIVEARIKSKFHGIKIW